MYFTTTGGGPGPGGGNNTYYLCYNSGYSLSTTPSSVYLYVYDAEIPVETTVVTGYTYVDENGETQTYPVDGDRYSLNYVETSETVEYTGIRYTQGTTFTGLQWVGIYGQTFEQAGYSWDTVSKYIWNEQASGNGGTNQTLLDGFTQSSNPYTLYCRGTNGPLRENLRGNPQGGLSGVPGDVSASRHAGGRL